MIDEVEKCPRCGAEITYNNRSGYTNLSWKSLCWNCVRK